MNSQTLLANPKQIDQEFVSDDANMFIRLTPHHRFDRVLTTDSLIVRSQITLCITFGPEPSRLVMQNKTDSASISPLRLAAHQPLAFQPLAVFSFHIEQPRPADNCLELSANFTTNMIPCGHFSGQFIYQQIHIQAGFAFNELPFILDSSSTTARTSSAIPDIFGDD